MAVDISNMNSKTTGLICFSKILEQYSVSYYESGIWLVAGELEQENPYAIFLSIRLLHAEKLLLKVIPLLKDHTIPFKLLKDNYTLNKVNGYGFGLEGVGKFITLYPRTEAELIDIVAKLDNVTNEFGGPEIPNMVRIGEIVYTKPTEWAIRNTPRKFKHKKRKRILGKYYIPVQTLRSLSKGDTTKCINIRNLSFSWCLIKQGKNNALDDFSGRDMIDRIHWQHQVLQDIGKLGIAPKIIDLFHYDHSAYLVLDYIEGCSLQQKVIQLRAKKDWKDLDKKIRFEILRYYLNAIDIVDRLHQHFYIHRDINDENFIVTKDQKVFIIDFELAYSVKVECPDPPFGLGTFGYMSPQQQYNQSPDFSDDVYSLGAVLLFLLTGLSPNKTYKEEPEVKKNRLFELSNDNSLNELALQCLDDDYRKRPELVDMKQVVVEAMERHLIDNLRD